MSLTAQYGLNFLTYLINVVHKTNNIKQISKQIINDYHPSLNIDYNIYAPGYSEIELSLIVSDICSLYPILVGH